MHLYLGNAATRGGPVCKRRVWSSRSVVKHERSARWLGPRRGPPTIHEALPRAKDQAGAPIKLRRLEVSLGELQVAPVTLVIPKIAPVKFPRLLACLLASERFSLCRIPSGPSRPRSNVRLFANDPVLYNADCIARGTGSSGPPRGGVS